jgi:long-chain acyl-CoA synthetase
MLRTELIRPVAELIETNATRHPDGIAFEDETRRLSWRDLARRTAAAAAGLRELGVGRGDRVALYLGNGVTLVEAYLALARAGAVAVSMNPQLTLREASYIVEDSGASLLITDTRGAEMVEGNRGRFPTLRGMLLAEPGPGGTEYEELAGSGGRAPDQLDLDAVAWILYTSGTTGRPKGVRLTQRGMLWDVAAWSAVLGLGSEDYVLSPIPLYHAYALGVSVLGALAVGARELVLRRFETDLVLRAMRDLPVTFFPGVPTMFSYLCQRGDRSSIEGTRMRLCMSGGAILRAELGQEFERRFQLPLLDAYGITETSTFVTFNWPTGTRVPGSCGLPLPGLAVRVVDPETGVDREPGDSGEIIVRGPVLTPGYHNLPGATAEAIRGGWYHTGDLGVLDRNGYLTIVGRLKELIISGGYNVAPAEIEEVATSFEAVVDCAAVAVPHPAKGEVPGLFVVWREGVPREQELLAHLRQGLAGYKVPERLYAVEEIPRTGSGKTLRYQLGERARELSGAAPGAEAERG